jgi:CRISPR-associated protein (TIGR03986 family)
MAPPKVIDSAYNFVPLSAFILKPEWGHLVSQDLPFADGVSGRLKLTITAHTPILVGGDRRKGENGPGKVEFFKLGDGRYAIPGSAIRGMIRSVIEIAGFGAMGMVDGRRLGVRDLTAPARSFYGDHLTHEISGAYAPLSKAGWLKYVKVGNKWEWQITPCEFARVEHANLEASLPGFKFDPGGRPTASDLYDRWQTAGGSLSQNMNVGAAGPHPHSRDDLYYRKATLGGAIDGTLVFTGAPNRRKHMEFFFFFDPSSPRSPAVTVPTEVMDAFQLIHEDSKDWKRWHNMARSGGDVPVFWLDDGAERPRRLGLAMMFRLAYDLSIGETIDNTNPEHRRTPTLDLATLMFGCAAETSGEARKHSPDQERGLKGRVVLSLAVAQGNPRPRPSRATVLNGPKPTYYPSYVCQPVDRNDRGRLRGDGYATYAKQGNASQPELRRPEIRGWKRYPVRPLPQIPDPLPPPPEEASAPLQSVLHPLPENTIFTGEVRFHNLRPEEFGALLWALTWGVDSSLRHALGMGKPFGFGQVSIAVDQSNWTGDVVPNRIGATPCSFAQYIGCFADYMDAQYRARAAQAANVGWRQSEQMVQLLAMANPSRTGDFPGSLSAMSLSNNGVNEFLTAKGDQRREPSLVLAEYAAFRGVRDTALFPRGQSEAGHRANPVEQPPPGPVANRPDPAGAQQFGLRVGQNVSAWGEFGRVVGFTKDAVLIDFGDGTDPVDPKHVKLR